MRRYYSGNHNLHVADNNCGGADNNCGGRRGTECPKAWKSRIAGRPYSQHRLFSFIAQNRRGQPPARLQAIVELIGHTRTAKGLVVRAELDEKTYPKGIAVPDEQLELARLDRHESHGEWNYTIKPRR